MDHLFSNFTALQYQNKALRREVEAFRNGEKYRKLQADYSRMIAGYVKEIKRLKNELAKAHAATVTVRNLWFDVCDSDWEKYQAELNKKDQEIQKLTDKNWELLKAFDDKIASLIKDYEKQLAEMAAVIHDLEAKLAHAEALLGRDSTNTSTPTGQTPPWKNKHVPNSRRNTGRPKGGQPGHQRHILEKPAPEEVDEEVEHPLGEGEVCPKCGSEDFIFTGEYEEKYEIDIEVKVIRRLHKFWLYRCGNCGQIVCTGIDPALRAECQYGAALQAFSLSLMNTANAAINKVPLLIDGLTGGEVHPSEGYIAKLQPRAAKGLKKFREDLLRVLITRPILYWDDTVVMADKSRICLRFYGDETVAYYVAHAKKDLDGVLADGILEALTEMTRVMHDHNSINYNVRFVFINLECNAHLQRDLQKSADETGHTVLLEIKQLITTTIKDRNDRIQEGETGFGEVYIENFHKKMTELLERAEKEAAANTSIYSGAFERALVARIINYRENFFAWVEDFSLPTTNNLSERALRGVKTKTKVSGQFASTETADYYAAIRTYIETCRRNGINEMAALMRLCSANPYTVEEIFRQDPQPEKHSCH